MNGVAEFRHQILEYQARTMLLQANLLIGYWAEAINTANYILNLLPTSTLQGKTPHEMWTGRKPSIHHLRVFGAPTYAHIHDSKRSSKFDTRAAKLILVGYMDELRAYKLLHPQTHKVIYSHSITVNEGAVLHSTDEVNPEVPEPTSEPDGEVAEFQEHTVELASIHAPQAANSKNTAVPEEAQDASTTQFGTMVPVELCYRTHTIYTQNLH